MLRYALRRLAISVLVLFGAATVVFFAMRAVSGDPATAVLGPDADQAAVEALRREYGLDAPLPIQYVQFLRRAVTLDFGESFRLHDAATNLVFTHLSATAALALTAFVIALVLGFALGTLAATRPHGVVDRVVSVLSMLTQSLPTFWVGIMLILVFSRFLHLLPSSGAASPAAMIMPAVTLALPLLSVVLRLVRSGLLDVLHEDYVVTARAKGLSETRVVGWHAMRNMLIPVVTVAGLEFGSLLGGAVIVETVFAWPGVGRLMTDAIAARDYSVVQACVITVAVIFIVINLIVDLLYVRLDPRVRESV
ncbi:peptide/nickel transport system permease protein [Micromonospora matsumotoense]|uniref:Peptide/nickel transport system permease protein n=1 Tax=Micromonospora matsumotoense TaxID=121616 RepID=A0A1C4Z289_9ACTN|nr:ABC transporter permease [Micromonospora matsumotoense]SCF27095.1 peptide/nickel transport system permease protein [Micromonospora matsumotoense]